MPVLEEVEGSFQVEGTLFRRPDSVVYRARDVGRDRPVLLEVLDAVAEAERREREGAPQLTDGDAPPMRNVAAPGGAFAAAERGAPTRFVFDEGHHVFDAADSTFSAALTGQETIELRRWIVGPERGNRGRRRGLAG